MTTCVTNNIERATEASYRARKCRIHELVDSSKETQNCCALAGLQGMLQHYHVCCQKRGKYVDWTSEGPECRSAKKTCFLVFPFQTAEHPPSVLGADCRTAW